MRALVVTEKCSPELAQRDGGARLVASLLRNLDGMADVLQFDNEGPPSAGGSAAACRHRYPASTGDRFERRISAADFVAARVREVAHRYTHVLFVHVSMQFGFARAPLSGPEAITFPMFLTPSYVVSGERVPSSYRDLERRVLASTDRVLTPSHLERRQLTAEYGVPEKRIRVIPRGFEGELLSHRARTFAGAPRFCSIGSIKRQKNTVGLIRLFHAARSRHPGARLRVVGPVQDVDYAREVSAEIARLELTGAVELVGHVPPDHLAAAIEDAHVNLSASHCETFGRAIFETLASGIPNIAPARGNAAAEYLDGAPYARFYDDTSEALASIDSVLADYGPLSAMAMEVRDMFDDAWLGRLLAEEIKETDILAVADLDAIRVGDGPVRPGAWVEAFHQHPVRVVCSARGRPDLLVAMATAGVSAHFAIGPSVGTATGGQEKQAPAGWERSKLRSVVRLLRRIDWRGRVRVFGEGSCDPPLCAYFDGPAGKAGPAAGRERR